ncbi:MAG: MaoC family dehydratase [Terriglobales bacterium]
MESRYYEELNPGDTFRTPGRTIDQGDINRFAGLSGDHHQLHTDEEYSRNGLFGKRVAHGILTLAITSGLLWRLGIFEKSGLGHLGSTEKYLKPVFAGDTLYAEMEILSKRPMAEGRGIIAARVNTKNQKDEIVLTQEMNVMVRCRPVAGTASAGQ